MPTLPHPFQSNKSAAGPGRQPIRHMRLLGLVLVCGVVFALLTVQAAQGEFLALDPVMRTEIAAWQQPLVIAVMRHVTSLAGMPWLPLLIGVVMLMVWRTYNMRILLLWSGHTIASTIVFHGIRFLVARPRPFSHAAGYPSGHTVAAVAFYGLIIYLLWPKLRSFPVWRAVVCSGLLLIIIGVGFSRIVLEKHWFSDVLGAYVAGGFYLATCAWLLERLQLRQVTSSAAYGGEA